MKSLMQLTAVTMATITLSLSAAEQPSVMCEAYQKLWNPEVQARIDRGIDKNRKADCVLELEGGAAGTEVKVEQLSHDFVFGGNIFLFGNWKSPAKTLAVLDCLKGAERPIHVSEVTVSAPDESERGSEIQAVITRNLYRLWFSYPDVMGITWWNVVDGGAAPGEPSFSGLYDTELRPKPAYKTLDKLINGEWKTRTTVKAGKDGAVKFRGFKGKYRATYKDASGTAKSAEFHLEKDGVVRAVVR